MYVFTKFVFHLCDVESSDYCCSCVIFIKVNFSIFFFFHKFLLFYFLIFSNTFHALFTLVSFIHSILIGVIWATLGALLAASQRHHSRDEIQNCQAIKFWAIIKTKTFTGAIIKLERHKNIRNFQKFYFNDSRTMYSNQTQKTKKKRDVHTILYSVMYICDCYYISLQLCVYMYIKNMRTRERM